jgi:hypothetical protein
MPQVLFFGKHYYPIAPSLTTPHFTCTQYNPRPKDRVQTSKRQTFTIRASANQSQSVWSSHLYQISNLSTLDCTQPESFPHTRENSPIMARPSLLAYLHSLLTSIPQHGYHNISRVIQPQIRSLGESIIATAPSRAKGSSKALRRMLRFKRQAGANDANNSGTSR